MKEKCSNHPEKQALNFCHSCGKYFCEECLVEGQEFYYCHGEQCIAAKSKQENQNEINTMGIYIHTIITDKRSR